MEPEVDELRRRFGHDRPRLYDAIYELYGSRGVDPLRGYRPLLVAGVMAAAYNWTVTAGMFLRLDRRALNDRLAGVVVVRPRAAGSERPVPSPWTTWAGERSERLRADVPCLYGSEMANGMLDADEDRGS